MAPIAQAIRMIGKWTRFDDRDLTRARSTQHYRREAERLAKHEIRTEVKSKQRMGYARGQRSRYSATSKKNFG